MAFYDPLIQYLRRIMALSTEEATRWQRFVKFAVNLARHCAGQLRKDNAPQMAAALTYHTIFGLVPLLVLALIVFRAFGGFENLGDDIENRIYDYLGISPIAVEAVEPDAAPDPDTSPDPDPAAAPDVEPSPEEVAEARGVREIISELEQRIGEVSFAGIGMAGLAVLIWAAIGLLVTIEGAFNRIFVADRGRSWAVRVPIYWAVITLGPVLAGLSLWMTGQVIGWIGELDVYVPRFVQWVLDGVSRGVALAATWLLLTLLYVLLPNTTVNIRPALIGALVAAVGWELAKWGFQLYVQNAVTYSVLYGTLGLIPLFLIWVYLSWLIILFGLELTYTLQTMPEENGSFEEKPATDDVLVDARWLIPMMAAVGEAFERGESVGGEQIARRLGLPMRTVTWLGRILEDHGLVHRLEGQDHGGGAGARYTLAMPPQRIGMSRLLEAGEALVMDRHAVAGAPAHALLEQLDKAQHKAVEKLTLADVLSSGDTRSP